LSVGMRLYEEVKREVTGKGDKVIPGDVVYRLYDTFGFPVDITDEMAREDGLSVDVTGFEAALNTQKERSRTDWRLKKEGLSQESSEALAEDLKNVFTGYETLQSDGTILAIVKDGKSVDEIGQGEEGSLFFDVTPFYGEGGGQISDEGSWCVILRRLSSMRSRG